MRFQATPIGFRGLVRELSEGNRITPAIQEDKRVVERDNGRSVTLKVVFVTLYKSQDATVRVDYKDGEVEVRIIENGHRYYSIDWSPFDLRNLAKALELAANISEQWYVRKYAVEHPEELVNAA